ncbi:MAG TPA: hypothetical protein VF855_14595 [Acidimicrobiales bacterium]
MTDRSLSDVFADDTVPYDPVPDEPERTLDEDEAVAGLLPARRPGDIEVPEADAIDQSIIEPLDEESD